MRIVPLVSTVIIIFLLAVTETHFSSCTKDTVYDTITVRDTLTVRDTVTIIDSVCGSCYDLKKGLVAYYNFNGGTLNDSSGNSNNIVFNNAVKTTDRFGNADNAYLFDGSSSYMRVLHSNTLNLDSVTLMATIKINGFYTGSCSINNILSKGYPDPVGGMYSLRIGNYDGPCETPTNIDRERFSGGIQTSGMYTDTVFAKTGQWYNVVFTFDGDYSKIYVNGILKEKQPRSISLSQNTQDLFIGKHGDSQYPYWFNGIMDEIRIYNRALCDEEVKMLSQLKN